MLCFRLLTVDERIFKIETIAKMKALYNNYEQNVDILEILTEQERVEEQDFLTAVLATPVMKYKIILITINLSSLIITTF